MIKKILYSRFILKINKLILGCFYEKKYLKGKFFDEKRGGFIWAWRGLPSKIFGKNRKIPWPIGKNTIVSNAANIEFDNSSINIFQLPGCYFQCHKGKITIGKEVHIAPNCGIITTNHDIYNPNNHIDGKDIIIGDACWIGMNSVILPGVKIGEHTVVGAGAIVTKSFPEGYVVIAGNPAKIIYRLDKDKVNESSVLDNE